MRGGRGAFCRTGQARSTPPSCDGRVAIRPGSCPLGRRQVRAEIVQDALELGRGAPYVGAYGQLRSDYAVTPHVGLAVEFVRFLAGPTIVSAGGHNTDYLATEVRCGW